MPPFIADLHVHSRYSRATSRDLDLEHLAWWAACKGIAVVATGDCVHPAWLAEIRDKLRPDGGGLFRLRPDIEAEVAKTLPPACRRPVRFMLSTEISTIYKKGDKTRKVHHLIYSPSVELAEGLAARLARIGNIASDGRPILGLDSRDLLEVVLEAGPDAYLVPAHIWTPWFSALGAQSGFESIDECYGDLARHVFAVETGLSSDPAMIWRISSLDRFRLVSSSDAHSPAKLGREATRFTCEADYFAIRRALESGEGYGGTVEFFPEEGKYHQDGHRDCQVRLTPKETLALGGRCPACGRPVTVGVAHRVEVLADRDENPAPPPTAGPFASLVPLPEILGEILDSGVAAQRVSRAYDRTIAALGPELSILDEVPVDDIARVDSLLGEAVSRLRRGAVIRQAGYDGEYGVIRLFAEGELDRLVKGGLLFDAPATAAAPRRRAARPLPGAESEAAAETGLAAAAALSSSGRTGVLAGLDPDQARAAALVDGPLAVIAGPGSGKTRMVTHRIAHLVGECKVPAASCLAITFTRRATEELRSRLVALLPDAAGDCAVHSFHSLGLAILRAHGAALGLAADFRIADEAERSAALVSALGVSAGRAARLVKTVSVLKRTGQPGDGETAEARQALARLGREQGWVDFDDLVGLAVALLDGDPAVAALWQSRFTHILADEFQDIDEGQYRLLRLLAGPAGNLCVVGDPDQAIYGFRGADATCFDRFALDYPESRTVRLDRNYRSTATIVAASAALVGRRADGAAMRPPGAPVLLHTAPSEAEEAAFVAAAIEELMGGHDMLAANRGQTTAKTTSKTGEAALGFADFAVLYRTDAQSAALREAFDRAGIPFGKSSPAAIADHPGIAAILDALASGEPTRPLAARLSAAADAARINETSSPALLAEAKGWLLTLAAAADIEGDEGRLREQVALATEADFHDARADRVSLLTMHAAKGLEFSTVFVVGLEDGVTPFSFPGQDETAGPADEERRLFYVAATRAKDRLILTHAAERLRFGQVRRLPPSPFLAAIPETLCTRQAPAGRRRRPKQFSLF